MILLENYFIQFWVCCVVGFLLFGVNGAHFVNLFENGEAYRKNVLDIRCVSHCFLQLLLGGNNFSPTNIERVTSQMCTEVHYIQRSLKLPDLNKKWSGYLFCKNSSM